MDSLKPADVVIADFPGVMGVKRRPAVVLSTVNYHTSLEDVILGAVTTNLTIATKPTDHFLIHWREAGLRRPSAFRTFLATLPQREILAVIGHLSDVDSKAVEECVRKAIALLPRN